MLHELYIEKQWSSADIAKKFEICKHTVLRRLREAGYQIRPPEHYFTKKLPENARKPTWELGYILGVIYGDGHLHSSNRVYSIDLHTASEDWGRVFYQILMRWSALTPWQGGPYSDGLYRVALISKEAYQYIKSLITKSNMKDWNVPEVAKTETGVKSGFLSGWFDSEGNVYQYKNHRNIRGFSVNQNGLYEIQTLLKSVDIKSGVWLHNSEKLSWGKYKSCAVYCVNFGGERNLKLFRYKIGFQHPSKKKQLDNVLSSYWVNKKGV